MSACAGMSSTAPPESPVPESPAPPPRISGTAVYRTPALPKDYEFLPQPLDLSALSIPSGVGLLTRNPDDALAKLDGDQKTRLSARFREAYLEGFLREVPLAGVLGGDLVHGWPGHTWPGQVRPGENMSWVQNWRLGRERSNSWGIPSLALAIAGPGGDMVFLVHDAVLDRYGRTGGRLGANGAAGYGAPLGNEFYYRGGTAQRFEGGLVVADADGKSRFVAVPADATVADDAVDLVAAIDGPGIPDRVRAAFRSAIVSLPPDDVESVEISRKMVPDGGIAFIDFSAEPGAVGFYLQSFNRGTTFLVLVDSPRLPFRVRLLSGPFLDVLLSAPAARLPGATALSPDAALRGAGFEDAFVKALLEGFALYGIPLGDPQPWFSEGRITGEAQRFSRGWMLGNRILN
ncbi:MAG: hypothetical protein LBT39_05905 [Treponema sp.]|nr:hypothetical protein [Treponema sp.]